MKYERTFHLPWSPGVTKDDKKMSSISGLLGVEVVITEKMDGSNVCMEAKNCFARTHSKPPARPSFDAFKQLHAELKWQIPPGTQVFGEWLYARHSIAYRNLPGYFLIFGVRELSEMPRWLPWADVEAWALQLHTSTVPVLYRGLFATLAKLRAEVETLASAPSLYGDLREGVVIKVARTFNNDEFPSVVGKWVRANHNTLDSELQPPVRNGLR